MLKLDVRGKRVLLISDLHHPFAVDDWFEFLSDLHKKRKYDIIISMGDECDGAGISFHENEDGMPSASKELEEAIACMNLMSTLFPKMYILESNHGSLIFRKSKFHGIPYAYIKPLPELYGTPGYSWHSEILLQTSSGPVYLCHGKKSSYAGLVKDMGISCIQAHFHSKAEITYHKTIAGVRFNMFVGCLADQEKIAFNYSRANVGQFINCVGEIGRDGKPNLIFYKPVKKA
jgi:hypothetical protein